MYDSIFRFFCQTSIKYMVWDMDCKHDIYIWYTRMYMFIYILSFEEDGNDFFGWECEIA